MDMENRIGREKRHLEVGEEQYYEEEGAHIEEQGQTTIVREGFYGPYVELGLFYSLSFFYFFIFLFIPKHAPALKCLMII